MWISLVLRTLSHGCSWLPDPHNAATTTSREFLLGMAFWTLA